jgi:hypothetical protein
VNRTASAPNALARRELFGTMLGVAAASLSGACGLETSEVGTLAQPLEAGFTESDHAIAQKLVSVLIPTDSTPGGVETGSAGFALSNFAARGAAAIAGIQQALQAVDQIALASFGTGLVSLSEEQAHSVMLVVASSTQLAAFWQPFRTLSVSHYYAHPIGTAAIGMPGPTIDSGGFPGGRRPPSLDLCPVL